MIIIIPLPLPNMPPPARFPQSRPEAKLASKWLQPDWAVYHNAHSNSNYCLSLREVIQLLRPPSIEEIGGVLSLVLPSLHDQLG